MQKNSFNDNKNQRQQQRKSLFLVLPLLLFLLVFFIAPIAFMLVKSVYNPAVKDLLTNTSKVINTWNYHPNKIPDERVYQIFSLELASLAQRRLSGRLAQAINRIQPQSGTLIKRTANVLKSQQLQSVRSFQTLLIGIDKQWGQPRIWASIKNSSKPLTVRYYANALDYEVTADNQLKKRSTSQQIYLPTLIRTLWIALLISVLCILLGYPVAYYIAHLPTKKAKLMLLFVLLPFWSAFLVRTSAWIAILQSQGIVNKVLIALGIISKPLDLLYNQFAMVIAMVHILLPFMILPLYSVMKSINPSFVQASISLGASQLMSFLRIYLPLSLPGLAAGSLLVFVICLGYYITPALLGGVDGQLISNLIALHMRQTNNWSLASALGGVLLVMVLLLYFIYDKKVGLKSLKF